MTLTYCDCIKANSLTPARQKLAHGREKCKAFGSDIMAIYKLFVGIPLKGIYCYVLSCCRL